MFRYVLIIKITARGQNASSNWLMTSYNAMFDPYPINNTRSSSTFSQSMANVFQSTADGQPSTTTFAFSRSEYISELTRMDMVRPLDDVRYPFFEPERDTHALSVQDDRSHLV